MAGCRWPSADAGSTPWYWPREHSLNKSAVNTFVELFGGTLRLNFRGIEIGSRLTVMRAVVRRNANANAGVMVGQVGALPPPCREPRSALMAARVVALQSVLGHQSYDTFQTFAAQVLNESIACLLRYVRHEAWHITCDAIDDVNSACRAWRALMRCAMCTMKVDVCDISAVDVYVTCCALTYGIWRMIDEARHNLTRPMSHAVRHVRCCASSLLISKLDFHPSGNNLFLLFVCLFLLFMFLL